MVTQAATLSPLDQALLTRLFEVATLKDLFDSLKNNPVENAPTTLFALTQWAHADHIKPWIDIHAAQQREDLQRELIEILKTIAKSSDNQVERRRAATTILRSLGLGALSMPRVGMPRVGRASGPPSDRSRADRGTQMSSRSVPTANHSPLAPESPKSNGSHESLPPCPADSDSSLDASMPHASMPSSSSSLSTQSSALPEGSGPKTKDSGPRLPAYDWSRYMSPQLESLSLPATPELDAARLAFFAGGDSAIRVNTPANAPRPHPTTPPQRVILNVLHALAKDRHTGLITAFNHSGVMDRSVEAFNAFVRGFAPRFPHLSAACDPNFRNEKQTASHEFSCICSPLDWNYRHVNIRCTLKRPTEGPLALCWLLTMEPQPRDTS